MEYSIQTAQFEDIAEIEKIHLKHYQEIGQKPGAVQANFATENRIFLVAKSNSAEVIGYLAASVEGDQSYAEWIGVKYENQKIGTMLANSYIEECKKRNIKTIRATTRNRFKKALISYVKYGFEIYGLYQGGDGDVMIQVRKTI